VSDDAIPLPRAIRLRLEEIRGPVDMEVLSPHLERDAVFVVAPGVDLIECGVAIGMDDVDAVRGWIERGQLRRPSLAERRQWASEPGRSWQSVVVQPFVLIQG
jgi:hypothetical protein